MKLTFSEIGHRLGWCPKKRRSQIVLDQGFMGITTAWRIYYGWKTST